MSLIQGKASHVKRPPISIFSTNQCQQQFKFLRARGHAIAAALPCIASLFFVFLGVLSADIQPQSAPPTDPSPNQIVQFLSQTIDWYRQSQQEQHIATEPADLGFAADNRRMADQVVKLAFDFARQEEQRLAQD
jgi:hypothetical protein